MVGYYGDKLVTLVAKDNWNNGQKIFGGRPSPVRDSRQIIMK